MPTITIPAASVEYVDAENGGIYVNALKGRSIKAKMKFEDGTERDVSIRTVVVHAPTNQNTVLASADKSGKAKQSGEVQTLSARVEALAKSTDEKFNMLLEALTAKKVKAAK